MITVKEDENEQVYYLNDELKEIILKDNYLLDQTTNICYILNHSFYIPKIDIKEYVYINYQDLKIIKKLFYNNSFKLNKFLNKLYYNKLQDLTSYNIINNILDYKKDNNLILAVQEIKKLFNLNNIKLQYEKHQKEQDKYIICYYFKHYNNDFKIYLTYNKKHTLLNINIKFLECFYIDDIKKLYTLL